MKIITAKEFVELFYIEKNHLLKHYFDSLDETEVGLAIKSLSLTSEQMSIMKNIINTVLTDVMYTILLGLDGEASIGNVQQTYRISDESGKNLSECGEIEHYAFEYFQTK